MVNSLGITNDKSKVVNANTISKNKQITLQSSVSAGKISDFRIPIFIFFATQFIQIWPVPFNKIISYYEYVFYLLLRKALRNQKITLIFHRIL